jgi:hypothetical protein
MAQDRKDHWTSEADTVERVDREAERQIPADEAGGITNRPLEEEKRNQDRLPDRGGSQKR